MSMPFELHPPVDEARDPGGSYAALYEDLREAAEGPKPEYNGLRARYQDALTNAVGTLLAEAQIVTQQRVDQPGDVIIAMLGIDGIYTDDDAFTHATRTAAAVTDARKRNADLTTDLLIPGTVSTEGASKVVRDRFPAGLLVHGVSYVDQPLVESKPWDAFKAGLAQFTYDGGGASLRGPVTYGAMFQGTEQQEVAFPRLPEYTQLAQESFAAFAAAELAVFREIDLQQGYTDMADFESELAAAAKLDATHPRSDNLRAYEDLAQSLPKNPRLVTELAAALREYRPGQELPASLVGMLMVPDIDTYALLGSLNKNAYSRWDRTKRTHEPGMAHQLSVVARLADVIQVSLFPMLSAHKDRFRTRLAATLRSVAPQVEEAEAFARHTAGDEAILLDPMHAPGRHWTLVKTGEQLL